MSHPAEIVSFGGASGGPWIIMERGDEFYDYMRNQGRTISLDEIESRLAPNVLADLVEVGDEAIRVELNAGHYLYVVRKSSSVAVWSITL